MTVSPTICTLNRHEEYRLTLMEHIIAHTLVHWDQSMRLLGAQSLKTVCELDLTTLGPQAEARVVSRICLSSVATILTDRYQQVMLLSSVDTNDVHGGLLGLSELAASYKGRGGFETERSKVRILPSCSLIGILFIKLPRSSNISQSYRQR